MDFRGVDSIRHEPTLTLTRMSDTVTSTWHASDIVEMPSFEGHDLVLMAYVLGELSENDRRTAVSSAWEATREALVIVEPGTSSGAARVLDARAWLIDEGGELVAPCPHTFFCSSLVFPLVCFPGPIGVLLFFILVQTVTRERILLRFSVMAAFLLLSLLRVFFWLLVLERLSQESFQRLRLKTASFL